MSTQTDKKGKLELLLDEFSEVHGTVLLGMHKELQTLKVDVERRVQSQIGEVLEKIKAADFNLHNRVEDSQKLISQLERTRADFSRTLDQVERQRSSFQAEISTATNNILQVQKDYEGRMSALVKVASQLNNDSQSTLQAVQKQSEELHLREISIQQRTVRAAVLVGLINIAVLGGWAWLTLPR